MCSLARCAPWGYLNLFIMLTFYLIGVILSVVIAFCLSVAENEYPTAIQLATFLCFWIWLSWITVIIFVVYIFTKLKM